jgi:hypothetical protein
MCTYSCDGKVIPTPFGPYRGRPTCVARAANRSPVPILPCADSAVAPRDPPNRGGPFAPHRRDSAIRRPRTRDGSALDEHAAARPGPLDELKRGERHSGGAIGPRTLDRHPDEAGRRLLQPCARESGTNPITTQTLSSPGCRQATRPTDRRKSCDNCQWSLPGAADGHTLLGSQTDSAAQRIDGHAPDTPYRRYSACSPVPYQTLALSTTTTCNPTLSNLECVQGFLSPTARDLAGRAITEVAPRFAEPFYEGVKNCARICHSLKDLSTRGERLNGAPFGRSLVRPTDQRPAGPRQ